MRILLTGGLGYIGSHCAVQLSQSGYEVTIIDNLSNSNLSVLENIRKTANKHIDFILADIRDLEKLKKIFIEKRIDAVIHLAGLKSIPDSFEQPLDYYSVNVQGAISLLQAMSICKVYKLVFSSSASVYGSPKYHPIDEIHPLAPNNPYSMTKLTVENLLKSLSDRSDQWKMIVLRYFNPVGAHDSLNIGELPEKNFGNLMPNISAVAFKKAPYLNIYGNNYNTSDGTALRDFIHVMDLADGHEAALKFLTNNKSKFEVINLGTGVGHTVLEVVNTYQNISGLNIKNKKIPPRFGDIDISYADVKKAEKKLGWKAKRDLSHICSSEYLWKKNYYKKTI